MQQSKNKNKDLWITPPAIWKILDDEFHFDKFDPCPINWKVGDPNGLEIEWACTTFVNPPVSQLSLWIEKADKEWRKRKTIVFLMNLKTNLSAFYDIVLKDAVEIRFLKGRVDFLHPDGKKSCNPFPTLVVIWRKEKAPTTL